MKFLFIAASHRRGGAEIQFVTLARALASSGHTVEAVVYPDAPVAELLAGSAVPLHFACFRNAVDPRGFWRTMTAARRLQPDWLVGGTGKEHLATVAVGRSLGIAVALMRHRLGVKKLAARLMVPRAQRFLAVSEYARRNYIRSGVPATRVQVLPNAVDTELLRPDPIQRSALLQALGMSEDENVVGCFGRMFAGKGIFVLLEAVNAAMVQEPSLHCLWLGDGSAAPELGKRIAASPFASRHRQLGWRTDVHKYYNALSMLAVPAITPEAFGRTSIEAQACGVPVLASDIGSFPETIEPGVTGILLPPGDVQAWRDAILMLCSKRMRVSMAAAAPDFVRRHFSTDRVAEQFISLLGGANLPASPQLEKGKACNSKSW